MKFFVVEEQVMRKSADKVLEEAIPIPTTPMEDEVKSKPLPDVAPPSPVDTGAITASDVEVKAVEEDTSGAPPVEKEPEGEIPGEGGAPTEGTEVTAPEEGTEGAIPGEGGELPTGGKQTKILCRPRICS